MLLLEKKGFAQSKSEEKKDLHLKRLSPFFYMSLKKEKKKKDFYLPPIARFDTKLGYRRIKDFTEKNIHRSDKKRWEDILDFFKHTFYPFRNIFMSQCSYLKNIQSIQFMQVKNKDVFVINLISNRQMQNLTIFQNWERKKRKKGLCKIMELFHNSNIIF